MRKCLIAPYPIVFPAPAGINRGDYRRRLAGFGVPRASGDKPGALDAMMDITWSSPPLR
ncbi:TPA: hypothetical protein JFB75_002801 [Escherichia coli]|nr:hypothetical protein [Escherichia coli]HAU9653816.1 hypothetical protein [Escherichia coli]HAU9661711.1 hypothetical protein [Escherichia coli]HAU9686417.1 hypothetical protein [Escherichia coli]